MESGTLTSAVLNTTASPSIPDVNHMSVDAPISAEDHFPTSGLDKDFAGGSMPGGSAPYITDPTLLNPDADHLSIDALTYDEDHYHVSDPLYTTGDGHIDDVDPLAEPWVHCSPDGDVDDPGTGDLYANDLNVDLDGEFLLFHLFPLLNIISHRIS